MLHIAKEASARGTQVTGLRGVADLGYGHSVGVYKRAAEDDARDLRGCERRLACARGGSGAVGWRWRPKAPILMVSKLSENPLARSWLAVEEHAEKAACAARRQHILVVHLERDAALNAHHRHP